MAATLRRRLTVAVQGAVSGALAVLWLPVAAAWMRFVLGWRIEDPSALRREYARLRREPGPLLVCANHLTLVDSFLVGWALGTPGYYARHWSALPWNVPERENFARSAAQRVLVWLARCIPVTRRGPREEVSRALERVATVLRRGDALLIFPEGGRSRSGRVDPHAAAWGVGRVVRAVPGCRVLCVYLRGEEQAGWSDFPRRGERFHARASTLEPKSEHGGVRGSMEVARQITRELGALEAAHLREHTEAPPRDRQ